MGMLYRRKKRGLVTGLLVEQGPWWMKYYDGGKPIYESTAKIEKREALIVLRRAEAKVADGQQEGSAVKRTRFEDLIEELKNDYILKRRKTWKLREQHLAHLRPVFGGMRVKGITTPKLQAYVAKRLVEGAAPATVSRELDYLHRMMILGQRHTPPRSSLFPTFRGSLRTMPGKGSVSMTPISVFEVRLPITFKLQPRLDTIWECAKLKFSLSSGISTLTWSSTVFG